MTANVMKDTANDLYSMGASLSSQPPARLDRKESKRRAIAATDPQRPGCIGFRAGRLPRLDVVRR
jgi:hypothetical protein